MRELERTVYGEFALDTSKLQRVVSIIQAAYAGTKHEITLVAILKNQKRITTHDLQHLIEMDNTITNPVVRLEIQVDCGLEGKSSSVVFRQENSDFRSGIPVSVKSDDAAWASRLFSELEEQVDRTILRDPVSKYRHSGTFRRLTPLIVMLGVTLSLLVFMIRLISRLSANDGELRSLRKLAESASSSDSKIDFLVAYSNYQMGRSEVLAKSGFPLFLDEISFPLLIGASPFLLVAGLTIYTLATCYPGSVFLWGDYAEHYATLVKRRSQIWNVVTIALLVGLLINLSSTVISRGIGIA
jgi:hypothetical protein